MYTTLLYTYHIKNMACDYCYQEEVIITFKKYMDIMKGKYFAGSSEDYEWCINLEKKPLECIFENNEYVSNAYMEKYDKIIKDRIKYHNDQVDSLIEFRKNNLSEDINRDEFYVTAISFSDIVSISTKTDAWDN